MCYQRFVPLKSVTFSSLLGCRTIWCHNRFMERLQLIRGKKIEYKILFFEFEGRKHCGFKLREEGEVGSVGWRGAESVSAIVCSNGGYLVNMSDMLFSSCR